ncbi:EF-hand domain-containing protein [Aliiroseovarius sp. F47248L]|uniref:EF-hand domain-containing protein n=1 Tax=Aliiroseovarius sp. F47248L TaxID=2926420 RepID=UPI001FF61891|nr:EF-hand domain-containing protein [Aliiroseovarius sp. F47248L]MCK0138409.1 EF-hand domain-containing protein [Aliiroseovarius sp. F47248L]
MNLTKKHAATAIALVLGAAVTLGSTSAMAFGGKDGRGMDGPRGGFMQMEFTDLDSDANGQITVEDLQANAQARFSTADADGNGELTVEELLAQRSANMAERQAAAGDQQKRPGPMSEKQMGWMIEKMIAKRDSNGNGTLSLDEMTPEQARLDRMIDRFDTDDDNAISQAEFDEAQKEAFMRGHGKGGKGKRNGG